jgi:amino acid adenylation domain-containing protein
MRQWVEQTVARILSLQPRRVLEIGCGTGLLLFRIAPHTDYYAGTDLSAQALDYVRGQLKNHDLPGVSLSQRAADALDDLEGGPFDAVILNSVVQYFPDVDYLARVLEQAAGKVREGGAIFIGDVRNLRLLEAFHTSVELSRVTAAQTVRELRRRVRQQVRQEKELALDPSFFEWFADYLPNISRVEIQLKRGNFDNEMSRFRYDVTLHIGGSQTESRQLDEYDWQARNLTLADVRQMLSEQNHETLWIKRVPNARVLPAVKSVTVLRQAPADATVEDLANDLTTIEAGIKAEDVWQLIESTPYSLEVRWSEWPENNCFDLVFTHAATERQAVPPGPGSIADGDWRRFANNPLGATLTGNIEPRLRKYLEERLPSYMIPATYISLPAMPLTPNGKIDRLELARLEVSSTLAAETFVAPRTQTEATIAAIWAEVLELNQVGIHSDFFDLGGHSLRATRVISRLHKTFGVELPLRALFEASTVAQLAERIDALSGTARPSQIALVSRETKTFSPSFAQQRLWFIHQLDPASASYNIPATARLTGRLRFHALEQTLTEIVRRHEVLRTTFVEVNGQPVQVIDPAAPARLKVYDLTALPESERETEARTLCLAEARQPFDLSAGPLWRASLVKLSDLEHLVQFTVHHIISDGWSMGVLIDEVVKLYASLTAQQPLQLPELQIQYRDFAAWQRDWLNGEVLKQQLSYWEQQLAGAPEALDLPTDYPRPPQQTFRAAEHAFVLPKELSESLKALMKREGVTPFMTLLAAFQILLQRYTYKDEIVVGAPVAGRARPEIEDLIGLFINTLVFRADLSANLKFGELLQRTRETTLQAHANQDVPFEKVVEELVPDRDLSRQPLFQAMMIFQNPPVASLDLGELRIEPASFGGQAVVRTDLDLYVWEGAEGFEGNFMYAADLFKPSTIERMAQRFVRLLENVAKNADARISELAMGECPALANISTVSETANDFPLSYHQERLWFIDQFETANVYESSPTYHNIPLILQLSDQINSGLLEWSLNEIVERHEALRTRIVTENARGRQVLSPKGNLRLKVAAVAVDYLMEAALEETQQPFNLASDLPIRAALFRTTKGCLLVVTVHHIVADKRSLQIIAEELAELYTARSEGRAPRLPELPIQFNQYSNWQLGFSAAVLDSLMFYWKWQLRGKLQVLELPEDQPRPAVHTYTAASNTFFFSERIARRIEELPADSFTTMLAAFKALLHRYANQDEIVVGTSVPCRDQAGTENMVGPIANLLVLRSNVGGNPSFRDLLAQVTKVVEQARAHQEMPFDKLVLELAPEKDMSRTALFDVLFQYEDKELPELNIGNTKARIVDTNLGYGKYDLNLSIRRHASGLTGTIVYNSDIYNDSTIEQMMRHLEVLLEAVTANPDRAIDDVVLLGAEEVEQQLATWNSTQAAYPADKTIHQLFEAQVDSTPDNTAIVDGDEALTYRELDRRANQLAHSLRDQGVGPDTLVAVCLEKSADMIVTLLAILKAGGGYLPLNPDFPEERLRFMLEDSRAAHLVTTARWNPPAKIESVISVIYLDRDRDAISAQPIERPASNAAPRNVAYCIYTSGSTGKPKGALVEHGNVVRLLLNDKIQFEFSKTDVWTMFHSYSFDFSVWEMYGALLYGGKLVIVSGEQMKDPHLFFDLLAEQKVTVLNQTPSAFNNLAREALKKPGRELALRYVIFGGEELHPIQLLEWRTAYPDVKLINMYGITETTVHVTFKEITEREIHQNVSNVGVPIPTTTTYIMDSKLRLLPVGVPGEICVGGLGVSRGYLDRDELTSQKFVANPYKPEELIYRSGDLAKLLPNGEMVYLGRMDDQVQIRGFRVELSEVRSHLLEHPAVAKAEVIATRVHSDTLELVAYIERSAEVTAAELRQLLAQTLPYYMTPSAFVMLKELPMTANGKLDRRALPAPEQAQYQPEGNFAAPRTAVQEILAGIWSQVLKTERVGVDDNFFELGGHSLLATRVISCIRDVFQIQLPLRVMFEQPTVAALAQVVEQERSYARQLQLPAIGSVSRNGRLPLSFAQQRLWFLEQLEPGSPLYNCPGAAHLRGKLDVAALEQSINEIVRRHESLRTSFATVTGEPVQVIGTELELKLEVEDLSALAAAERSEHVEQRAQQEARTGFDLANGPLLRVKLLRLAEDEHVVLFTFHHIVSDAWSLGVFLNELATHYQAHRDGRRAELAPLPAQYPDYAIWQREYLQGEVLDRQLSYWTRQLAGMPETLELPFDRPRGAEQTHRGAQQVVALNAKLAEELRAFSRQEGVTLYMTMLAAFDVLLHHYTGQDDIVVGTNVANRGRLETDQMIGFFVNQLPMRVNLSGDPTFRELLNQVRGVTIDAYAHQEVPFDRLVEALKLERKLSHAPLFQVKIDLLNAPALDLSDLDLSISPLFSDNGGSHLDLIFSFVSSETELTGWLLYNTDLFNPATVVKMFNHFESILTHIVTHPDARLSTFLTALRDAEKQEAHRKAEGLRVSRVERLKRLQRNSRSR